MKQDNDPVLMELAVWWGETYRKSFTGIPQRSCPLVVQGCPEAWLGALCTLRPMFYIPSETSGCVCGTPSTKAITSS